MAERNMTLHIDAESRDLTFDDNGFMELIFGDKTTAQCVRLTLQTWKEEFFLDITHGTRYERILGKKPFELSRDEIAEVLREAIFQETDIAQIDNVTAEVGGRTITASFFATLYNGQTISMEVST
jgi:hypothetical protein